VVRNNACGYHVLGDLAVTEKPIFHADLKEILAAREANRRRCEAQEAVNTLTLERYRKGQPLPLKEFRREVGNCLRQHQHRRRPLLASLGFQRRCETERDTRRDWPQDHALGL
jgi:hypothetical protein